MVKKIENYQLRKLIEKKRFTSVYRAINTTTNKQFAIKQIQHRYFQIFEFSGQRMEKFVKIIQKIDSPYIHKIHDVIRTKNNIYFVMDFYDEGSFSVYLIKKKILPEKQAIQFFKQMIQIYKICQCHSLQVHNFDPTCFFLHQNRLKLSDTKFGHCTFNDEYQDQTYEAPQTRYCVKSSPQADIWSFGRIILRIIGGQIEQNYKQCTLKLPQNSSLSTNLNNLISQMIQYHPEKRISWKQIFQINFQDFLIQ